jgi:hypothetical protein
MLTAVEQRAIARVECFHRADKRCGTGFLVAATRVLTAFHTLCGDGGQPVATPITVTFFDENGLPVIRYARSPLEPDCYDVADDWALLELTEPLPSLLDIQPLPLAPLRPSYQIPWSTYGFAEEEPLGLVYQGSVQSLTSPMQIVITNGHDRCIRGISGSPCIVDSEVVGIISRAHLEPRDKNGVIVHKSIGGTAFVNRIEVVTRRAPQLKLRDTPPPFHEYLMEALKEIKYLLLNAASSIGLVGLETNSLDDQRRKLAIAMLRGGLPLTSAALRAMLQGFASVDPARRAIRYAVVQWLHDAAVRRVADFITACSPTGILGINARDLETGRQYLNRAGYLKTPAYGAWLNKLCEPPPGASAKSLCDAVQKWLLERLHCDEPEQLAEEISYHRQQKPFEPLIVLANYPPPTPEAVAAVKAEYRDVNLVLLLGEAPEQTLLARYPGLVCVDPRIPLKAEWRMLRDWKSADHDVQSAWTEHHTNANRGP